MRFRPFTIACVVGSVVASASAAADLAAIEKPRFRSLAARVFTLDRAQEVRITGVTVPSWGSWSPARIWLLDGATRKVVWDADEAELGRTRRGVARFDDTVHLPAGEYELYLAAFPGMTGRWDRHGIDILELLRQLPRVVDEDDFDDTVEQLEVRVTGDGRPGGDGLAGAIRDRIAQGALAALVGVGDDADVRAGFALREATEVRVTCIGEAYDDGAADGGWIEDADTVKKVWRFEADVARAAGGAGKNRIARDVVRLPAGRYIARYVTDDSHAFPEFNSVPPDDPVAWGLVVRPVDPADIALAAPFDPVQAQPRNVLAALTEVRDDEHRTAGFTLRRPLAVRVVALGEGSRDDMYDLGWVVDARTRTTVWEMEYDRTEHAGGGGKNRVADEVVRLPAGDYVVHYVTDGSHSYGDWNTVPPLDRRAWGITVLAVDPSFTAADAAPFDPDSDQPALARITRVRSDQRREASFVLERDVDVDVYALGEWDGHEMADYGWIEDAGSGRTVWEMREREGERAGGARKNRIVRERIHLKAGSYRVFYETDGSHAYGDWNADPPRDPDSWGITVSLAERVPAEAPPGR